MTQATSTTVGQLYAALTQLGYTEIKMASGPLIPFHGANAERLQTQADTINDIALDLHGRDPDAVDQDAVDGAIAHVQIAQSMFDAINGNLTTTLTTDIVFDTVDVTIECVDLV